MSYPCFRTVPEGVLVDIKLTPKAARDSIDRIDADAAGKSWLRVRVTTVPSKGKANSHMIKFLSKKWKLPKSQIELIAGETTRFKCLLLKGEPASIMAHVGKMLKDAEI